MRQARLIRWPDKPSERWRDERRRALL